MPNFFWTSMHLLLIVVNVLYIIYDFTFIYLFSVFLFLFPGEISYTATLVNPRWNKEDEGDSASIDGKPLDTKARGGWD